jgi:hypothetical protein
MWKVGALYGSPSAGPSLKHEKECNLCPIIAISAYMLLKPTGKQARVGLKERRVQVFSEVWLWRGLDYRLQDT